jgi:hypothetical protein
MSRLTDAERKAIIDALKMLKGLSTKLKELLYK